MDSAVEQVVLRAVLANRLDTIAREMGLALERSAHSPIFAEACDFACGICDVKGELVSQLSGIPILAAAGSASVRAVLERYQGRIEDGDVFIVNDPYWGGNHLPDIGIITPVFAGGELLFFCVSRAHHGDIGGSVAGSYNAKATEIFQEGLRIPPLRLVSGGVLLDEVLDLITYNTRNPAMLRSDLAAQRGANEIGRQRLLEVVQAYGAPTVTGLVGELLARAEALVRERIAALPDGIYSGCELVDDDGFQDEPIAIRVTLRKEGSRLVVDLAGTDPQVQGFVNTALVTTETAARIAVLWVLGPDIPRNGGAFRAIEVRAPRGSLVNPEPPAPVTLSTLTPAGEIISAVFKAFAPVAGDHVPAGFGRFCGPSFFGVDPRSESFYVGFAFCALGSGGAMAGLDGSPYMAPISNYGGVRTPNIESNEVQYPHLTLRHEFEPDTGGAGRFRGGPGIRYEIRFYDPEPGIVMFGDGMKIPPYGSKGGSAGSPNRAFLTSGDTTVALGSKEGPRRLRPGDRLTLLSSGGGGWGDPRERDPEMVRRDVLDGVVSRLAARDVYAVVLSGDQVDPAGTARLREAATLEAAK